MPDIYISLCLELWYEEEGGRRSEHLEVMPCLNDIDRNRRRRYVLTVWKEGGRLTCLFSMKEGRGKLCVSTIYTGGGGRKEENAMHTGMAAGRRKMSLCYVWGKEMRCSVCD